jgi:CDP-paratose 2-epimerase
MPDLCRLVDLEIENFYTQPDGVFNIGGGQYCNTSLLECISLIDKLTKKKIKYTITDEVRKADQCVYISDISKAEKVYGWKPKIKMAEGLEQIIKWVKDNEKVLRRLYV